MDLLRLIHNKEITVDEAYDIYEGLIDAVHRNEADVYWWRTLGLTDAEAGAFARGANFAELAKQRYAPSARED